jgi:DNA-binding transcriptional MerR regulator
MPHPLLERYAGWSGTAQELVADLERIFSDPAISRDGRVTAPTLRTFRHYKSTGTVSARRDDRFDRRHLLEAAASRVMLQDGWKLEQIKAALAIMSDEEVAEIIQPTGATKNTETAASRLVAELKHRYGLPPADRSPSRMRSAAFQPAPMAALAVGSSIPQSQAYAVSADAAATVGPVRAQRATEWQISGLRLSVEADAARRMTEAQFDAAAAALVDAARTHLFRRRK